jgi:hypothetical protein
MMKRFFILAFAFATAVIPSVALADYCSDIAGECFRTQEAYVCPSGWKSAGKYLDGCGMGYKCCIKDTLSSQTCAQKGPAYYCAVPVNPGATAICDSGDSAVQYFGDGCGIGSHCCYSPSKDAAATAAADQSSQNVSCIDKAKAKFAGSDVSDPTCVAKGGGCPDGMQEVQDQATCTLTQTCCVKVTAKKEAPSVGPYKAGSAMTIQDPLGGVGVYGIIQRLITTFLGIVGAVALLVFFYAGVLYMTAGGDEKKVSSAKDAMLYGTIGLAIIFFAYAMTTYFFRILLTPLK